MEGEYTLMSKEDLEQQQQQQQVYKKYKTKLKQKPKDSLNPWPTNQNKTNVCLQAHIYTSVLKIIAVVEVKYP